MLRMGLMALMSPEQRQRVTQGRQSRLLDQLYAAPADQQMQIAQQSGMAGTLVPALTKQRAEDEKARLENAKTQQETVTSKTTADKNTMGVSTDRNAAVNGVFEGLRALGPNITKGQVLPRLAQLKNLGILDDDGVMSTYNQLPDDPAELQQLVASYTPITAQTAERGQDTSAQTAANAQAVQMRGQNVSAETSRYGQEQQNYRATAQIDAADRRQQALIEAQNQRLQQMATRANGQLVESNGQYYLVDKRTGATSAVQGPDGQVLQVKGGSDIPGNPQYQAKESVRIQKMNGLLAQAEGLIPESTGSYLGAGVDQIGRVFGLAAPGAVAGSQLKTIAGQLVMMMPRMEGPQSDKDVQLYREMAGDLANSTLPASQRMAALQQIRALQIKYSPDGQQTANPFQPQQNMRPQTAEEVGKVVTMADLKVTARESGKNIKDVVNAAKKAGFTIQ